MKRYYESFCEVVKALLHSLTPFLNDSEAILRTFQRPFQTSDLTLGCFILCIHKL